MRDVLGAVARTALSLRELCHVTKRPRNAAILLSRIIRNACDKRVNLEVLEEEEERKMAERDRR